MAHYTAKDAVRTVNAMPSGWVGSIPTWATILRHGRMAEWFKAGVY